jgi:hypothetical protein
MVHLLRRGSEDGARNREFAHAIVDSYGAKKSIGTFLLNCLLRFTAEQRSPGTATLPTDLS